MSTTLKPLYGTSNQAITCTFTSLGNASYRQSTVIDNSSNLFQDVLVTIKAKSASSAVNAVGTVQVFVYATTDGGSSYDGSCSGSDAAYTPPVTPVNLVLGCVLSLNANSVTDQRSFSLMQCFGGSMPQKWGIVVFNNTGATLDASVGSAWYQGLQTQAA